MVGGSYVVVNTIPIVSLLKSVNCSEKDGGDSGDFLTCLEVLFCGVVGLELSDVSSDDLLVHQEVPSDFADQLRLVSEDASP